MQSTITSRGQNVIPASIRHQFNLSPADRLEWVLDDDTIRAVPVRLLAERRRDMDRE